MFRNDLYESSTSLPSKPHGWDEVSIHKNHREPLTVKEIAEKLKVIADLDIADQEERLHGITASLTQALELITKKKTRALFLNFEVTAIFHALCKLPLDQSKHAKLANLLLERALVLASNRPFNTGQSAALLGAIAKLSFELKIYETLIDKLLDSFLGLSINIKATPTSILNELWQFCSYAKASAFANETITDLLDLLNSELAIRPQEVTTSNFQHHVDKTLRKLLSDACLEELEIEFPLGAYSLDLAFTKNKLNIEVDGHTHYRDERLSRSSQFRDFILQDLKWTVIRIPYFEWSKLTNKQDKIDYLLRSLAKHAYLFNEAVSSRLKLLTAPAKKDIFGEDPANRIPFEKTLVRKTLFTDTPAETKEQPSPDFMDSSRYLAEVFAGKFPGRKLSWSKTIKNDGTFFRLKKIKLKKKECAAIAKTAEEAQLDIRFRESKDNSFKVLIEKNSKGIKKARAISKKTGFFNHDEIANDNSKIVNLILQYSRKPYC